MCITRVGKVIALNKNRASVKLVGDDRIVEDIDVSMIDAPVDSYIEVYANLALSKLSVKEANSRKRIWRDVMRARN